MLKHLKVVERGFNQQVVEQLTELLERAKKGEFTESHVILKCGNGEFVTMNTGSDNIFELAGVLARAHLRTLRRADDTAT
jgi:hypothetical protein